MAGFLFPPLIALETVTVTADEEDELDDVTAAADGTTTTSERTGVEATAEPTSTPTSAAITSLEADGGVSPSAASGPSSSTTGRSTTARVPRTETRLEPSGVAGRSTAGSPASPSGPSQAASRQATPRSTLLVDGARSPADGARDGVPTTARQSEEFPSEGAAPEILAFDSQPISQPPIPL